MLLRSVLLLTVCLAAVTLLHASPINHPDTLLDQESDLLALESSNSVAVVREKRTIGFLRQAFPTLSQIIDRKIQAITRLLFRLIGRLVLRGNGGGGGGGATDSEDDGDRRVQITLPTFPPSADDEDEEEDEDNITTTTTEPSLDENAVAESKDAPVVVRKTRQAPATPDAAPVAAKDEEYEDDDQSAAATGDNEVAGSSDDEAAESDDTESADTEDDPRNKRFSLGGSGGSGGGSGNFLFDIIRLVAGSGTNQNQDEADNAPLDENSTHTGKGDDGYSAGVPGPLTRLFVIANRGIANLLQDLILRLAQTTERIVNFKARLITSII